MREGIRQLCLLSVLCGAALSLSPEGRVKKISSILCTAVLMLSILSPLKSLDFSSFALESAKLHEKEAELSLMGEEAKRRLSRPVIEEEYEAYIMDKAAELELKLRSVETEVKWSSEGLWVPYSVSLTGDGETENRKKLQSIIEAELGVAGERQHWSEND